MRLLVDIVSRVLFIVDLHYAFIAMIRVSFVCRDIRLLPEYLLLTIPHVSGLVLGVSATRAFMLQGQLFN